MRSLLLLLFLPMMTAQGAELLGHGVRSCDAYLKTYQGWEQNEPKAVIEFFHYQDWLAGFVSGLNYATGDDQLRGVGIPGVLRRNRIHCQEHAGDDFFSATMALIRNLKDLP